MSVSIKFGTLVLCNIVKSLKNMLDFGKNKRLNTSLMHSWPGAMANFPLLGSIFQVTDFKEKKF